MLIYTYKAALWCEPCGEKIRADLTAKGDAPEDPADVNSYDSDDFPKGPEKEGESDYPSHCDGCGLFLESALTGEGEDYVINAVHEAEDNIDDMTPNTPETPATDQCAYSVALTVWKPFYDLDYDLKDEA